MDSNGEKFEIHGKSGMITDPVFMTIIGFMVISLLIACCTLVRACKKKDTEGEATQTREMVVISDQ